MAAKGLYCPKDRLLAGGCSGYGIHISVPDLRPGNRGIGVSVAVGHFLCGTGNQGDTNSSPQTCRVRSDLSDRYSDRAGHGYRTLWNCAESVAGRRGRVGCVCDGIRVRRQKAALPAGRLSSSHPVQLNCLGVGEAGAGNGGSVIDRLRRPRRQILARLK
jgi:hypothetical protein